MKISELMALLDEQLELFGDLNVEYCYGLSAGVMQVSAQFEAVDLLSNAPDLPVHTLVIGKDYWKKNQRSL